MVMKESRDGALPYARAAITYYAGTYDTYHDMTYHDVTADLLRIHSAPVSKANMNVKGWSPV